MGFIQMTEAFYVPECQDNDQGEKQGWRATEITIGPWDAGLQHAGPPAALLVRELEQKLVDTDLRVARLLLNIRRPVPVDWVFPEAELKPGGKRVRQAGLKLTDEQGRELVTGEALLMRRQPMQIEPRPAAYALTPTSPDQLVDYPFPFFKTEQGYHTGMQVRVAAGEQGSGKAAAWFRMRYPLVPGETPSPWQRTMIAADSGNGISLCLDMRRYAFMNPDLSVALHREPSGDWIALDAETFPGVDGVGMAETSLFDEQGPIGRGVQTLLVEDLQR